MRSLADMPEDEYQMYVQPLLNAVEAERYKHDQLVRDIGITLGSTIRRYGKPNNMGDHLEVRIPKADLFRTDGEILRIDTPYGDEVVYQVRDIDSTVATTSESG